MQMNRLYLSEDVYSQESVKETCAVYKEYAHIEMKRENLHIKLTFSGCKYDPDLTIKEFENYLINVENSKK